MKIILLKDIPKVGRRFEVKDVSDGYAVNFLIPRALAEKATPQALNELQKKIKAAKTEEKIQEELLQKNFETLKNLQIKISRPGNETGHLFAGIHEGDVSKAIKEQAHISVPEHLIKIGHSIKTVGEHSVTIQSGERHTNIEIIIEKE